jgi:mono/diheme cytochrome c family protein
MRAFTSAGLAVAFVLGVWAVFVVAGAAQTAPPAPAAAAPTDGPAPPAEFTPEFLGDAKNIQRGREVWQARCQFCHGKMAYPGKAPKLQPSRYTPAFVYDRVANGFQGMPPWRHEFSVEQMKSVVAYVLSREFPN